MSPAWSQVLCPKRPGLRGEQVLPPQATREHGETGDNLLRVTLDSLLPNPHVIFAISSLSARADIN